MDCYNNVYVSTMNVDADKCICALAEKFNAFGILTQDTDFLIFQISEDVHIFWSKYLNWETMETIIIDRVKLAEHFNIPTKLLPTLATFKGNDIIPKEMQKKLHSVIYGNEIVSNHELLKKIANFVSTENIENFENWVENVFKDKEMTYYFKQSIESYFLTDEDIINPMGHKHEIDLKDPIWNALRALLADYQEGIHRHVTT